MLSLYITPAVRRTNLKLYNNGTNEHERMRSLLQHLEMKNNEHSWTGFRKLIPNVYKINPKSIRCCHEGQTLHSKIGEFWHQWLGLAIRGSLEQTTCED